MLKISVKNQKKNSRTRFFNFKTIGICMSMWQIALIAQPTGQGTNIIKNGNFEQGTSPANCNSMYVSQGIMTDWSNISSYGYCQLHQITECGHSNNNTLIFDKNAAGCGNYNFCGNNSMKLNLKLPFTTSGYRSISSNRMTEIGCGIISDQTNLPQRYGVTGKLNAALVANCIYTFNFDASMQDISPNPNNWCNSTNSSQTYSANKILNNPYTKVVLRLRKNNSCSVYKEIQTNIHVNDIAFKNYQFQFTICEEDVTVGYNQIEISFMDYPSLNFKVNNISIYDYSRLAFIDNVSLTQTTYTNPNTTLTNTTLNTATTWGSTVSGKINGTLTLNANFTINGAYVTMNKDAKIIVKSGKKLTITNSTLETQCEMWQGIEVQDGGTIEIKGSNINDAKVTVKSTGQSAKFNIENNTFKRFLTGLYIVNSNELMTSNSILNNNFDGEPQIKNVCLLNTEKRYGIILSGNRVNVSIGNTSTSNQFRFLDYGIYASGSPFDCRNNIFTENKQGIYSFKNLRKEVILITDYNNFLNSKVQGSGILITDSKEVEVFINRYNNFSSNINGIAISYCPGIKLKIGGTSTEKNWFNNNKTAIILQENGLNLPKSQTNQVAKGVTRYNIQNNFFSNSAKGLGIVMQEFIKGSNIIFDFIEASNNKFTDIGTGIKCTNINGLNENWDIQNIHIQKYYTNLNPLNNLTTRIVNNTMNYNSQLNIGTVGILYEFTSGVDILKNTIANSKTYSWGDVGIALQDSKGTLVQENTLNRNAVGLFVKNNMYMSNYQCNGFNYNINGIDMNNHIFRDNIRPLHGQIVAPNNHARVNTHSFRLPPSNGNAGGADISNVGINAANNQWMFQTNPPPIVIRPVTGIVFSQTGAVDCNKNKGTGGTGSPGGGAFSSTFTPFLTFMHQYYYESNNIELDSNIGSINLNISKLIQTENLIHQGAYSAASNKLNTIMPSGTFETNYKTVLGILLSIHPNDSTITTFDSTSIAVLRTIAIQNAKDAGPAAYLARAIVQYATDEDIRDPKTNTETIQGKITIQDMCTDSISGIPIALVDKNGLIIPQSLTYTDNEGKFSLYPGLFDILNPNTEYGFIIPNESNYSVTNTQYFPLNVWRTMGSSLTLNVLYFTKTINIATPNYQNGLSTPLAGGAVYNALTISQNGQTDIAIQKIVSGGIVWQNYYNAFANMNDTVKAICTDSIGNVYITGFVQDTFNTMCFTAKYNAAGVQQWVQLYKDANMLNTKGIGIAVGNDGRVHVQCIGSNNIVINLCYSQCGTSSGNGGGSQNITLSANSILHSDKLKVYPNPTSSILSVNLLDTESAKIIISDITGAIVYTHCIEKGINTLELNLSSGLFFYQVINNAELIGKGKLMIVK